MFSLYRKMRRKVKRLTADNKGGAAVEFAMVSPLFFAFLFSLFEAGLLFTRIAIIEDATQAASRQIYTGAAQSGGMTQTDIANMICTGTSGFVSCADSIEVEVQTVTGFNALPTTDAVCDESGDDINPTTTFNPGAQQEIVFVRVCVTVPILTPGLGLGLALPKTANDNYAIVTSLAFVNEPF